MCFSTPSNFLRILLFLLLSALFSNISKANDSDVINNLRPYKIVILGSSTAYGTGASTYDSSWVGKYQQYLKNKNSLNEVVNLAIPGVTTYNNLRPDYYTAPAGRPSTIYGNNITAAINMNPDAIIINMPSNDAVNYYTLDEQKENVEATIYLADSANIPVWITTSQPRNNLNEEQMALLTGFRDWVLTRFGNKSVDFWNNVANTNGSIADYYDYDAVHVNNFGHELFFSRMKAACILDSITARQINVLAGNDTTLILPNNQFVLRGNVSSVNNGNINYSWTKIAGPALFTIENENQIDATVSNLVEGNYSFELSAVDSLLNTKKDTINIIVKTRILIDFGPTTTTGADINGNYWNNVTSGTEGVKLQNAVTTNNLITPLGLQIVNRIDGLFNVLSQGVNTGSTIGDVGDYPNSVTTDYAFAFFNTDMGKWKITGLDSLKEYSVKFWGTRNATDVRVIEIKRADESVWKSYEAANNTNYNNAAIFTIRGKSEMTFDIKIPANSSFGHICLLDITRRTPADITNLPPTAIAGNDVNITLPINTVQLDGNQSFDNDQTITTFEWRKISGPLVYTLTNTNNAVATASGLEVGVYKFEIKVTDSEGGTDLDTVVVNVGDRILIDFGNTITTSPDTLGKYWNNVTSGTEGVKLINALTVGNATTNISLEVISRIDGTFNTAGPGVNTGNTTGAVNEYPNSVTTDYAFAHPSTNNGAWKISGLDSSKIYSIKFWGNRSPVSDNREIEIKTSEDSIWKSYNSSNNANYNNAVIIDIYGKSSVVFNIRVKTESAFGYISLIDINYSKPCIVTNSTTDVAVCKSQLPYTWNNINYTTAGTFTKYLINANGCDSIATLNLVVNDSSSSVTNASTCKSFGSFIWNGNSYNETGVYSVTLSNANGCDSIVTLNLVVNDSTASTTNASICVNQIPYVWNGNNYNISGIYSLTLANVNGCDSIASLDLIVNDLSESNTNITICNNQTPYVWNGNSYDISGTYSVTLSNANGCDSITSLNITINDTSSSITDATICANQTPYVWNGNNYNNSGIYSVTLTSENGCDSIASLNLVVNELSESVDNISICTNQTPYVWNGNNYNISGAYSVTLVNDNGCDSVASLNLIINDSSSSVSNISICTNQTPYVWNGNNYTISGTYSVTLSNANGCDSIASLNLTINNTSSSITEATICANQTPYVWNNNNYNISGVYSVTLVNANDCDSVATLNLVVNDLSESVDNISICTNQTPYVWNENNYSTSGVYSVTLVNANGCDSVANLNLTINNTTSSITNIIICTNQAPYVWNGNNYNNSGSYSVTRTNANGCDSIATLNLTINALPIVSAGTYNNVSVLVSSLPLIGSPVGGTFSGASVLNNTFRPSVAGSGTFNVTYTYTNPVTGCTNTATTTITVTCNFTVAATITGSTNACLNTTPGDSAVYSITTTDATTYTWSVSNATTMRISNIKTNNSVKILYTTAFTTGTVTVNIRGCNGTTIAKTLNITKSAPAAPVTTAGSRCGSGSILLSAALVSGTTINWYSAATAGTLLATATNNFNTPSITANTTYYAQAITGICLSATRKAAIATINVLPNVVTTLSNATKCKTDTASITATATAGLTIDWYADSTTSIVLKSGTATGINKLITPLLSATTLYWAVQRNLTTGCRSSQRKRVTVFVYVAPAAPAATGAKRCGTGTVVLNATLPVNPSGTVAWYNVATGGTSVSTTANYTTNSISTNTTYYVESKTTSTGCASLMRTPVLATINALPAVPVAIAGTGCTGSRITIGGTVSAGQTIDWYSAASAGTLLLSNSLSYTTPIITANTNYYATARNTTTACVSATRTTVAATVNSVLAAPNSLTGLTSICPIVGTINGTTYTANSVRGANSYFWTVPRGAVIDSGSIGLKIKVRYITASANDTISVQANNGCKGTKRSVRLTTTGCATTAIAKVSNIELENTALKIDLFPNPSSSEFNLKMNSSKDEKIKVLTKDVQGRILKTSLLNSNQNNTIGKDLKSGIYFMEIHQNNKIKVIRAVKS